MSAETATIPLDTPEGGRIEHMNASVWVVEKAGIQSGQAVAVLPSLAAAEGFTAAMRPDADGWHRWRVRELVLGETPAPEVPEDEWDSDVLTPIAGAKPDTFDDDEWIPLSKPQVPLTS